MMHAWGILRRGVLPALATVAALAAAPVSEGAAVHAQGGAQQQPPVRQQRAPGAERQRMERQLQQRMEQVVRTRLGLNDDQVVRLREVSRRFEGDRRTLRRDEAETRGALRRELLAGDAVNEGRVAELLDGLPRLERRRIDIIEAEQRELARFLSPSQRARYFALQDELRRSVQDVRGRAGGPGQPAGAGTRGMRRPPPPPQR